MKGRNTFTITLRLKDDIKSELNNRASKKGMTLGVYLTDCINRSVHTMGSEPVGTTNCSVHTTDKQKLLTELREKISKIEKNPYTPETMTLTMSLPAYDPTIHKVGDKVRIQGFGKRWKAIVVPEIDADGHPIQIPVLQGIKEKGNGYCSSLDTANHSSMRSTGVQCVL